MDKIVATKVNDSVYEQLLMKIKNGSWKSGDKLPSESELCAALGVSRGSVRSAIQRLKGMGLIEVKQGKGAFVCGAEATFDFSSFMKKLTLTENEMMEINEVRRMIENTALDILVSGKKDCDFSTLTETYNLLNKAAKECDYEAFTEHDYMFHLALISTTENRYLIQLARVLQNDFFIFLRESNKFLLRDEGDDAKTKEYFLNAFEIHEKIYRAVIHGDRKAAMSVTKSHAELNKERFGWYFDQMRKE